MSLPVKTEMAIFGMNGLWAAAFYFGGLFALYGQRNAGFKDKEDMERFWRIEGRKAIALEKGDVPGIKRATQEARQERAKIFSKVSGIKGFTTREFLR